MLGVGFIPQPAGEHVLPATHIRLLFSCSFLAVVAKGKALASEIANIWIEPFMKDRKEERLWGKRNRMLVSRFVLICVARIKARALCIQGICSTTEHISDPKKTKQQQQKTLLEDYT